MLLVKTSPLSLSLSLSLPDCSRAAFFSSNSQCHKFHDLSAFDNVRHSCRVKLQKRVAMQAAATVAALTGCSGSPGAGATPDSGLDNLLDPASSRIGRRRVGKSPASGGPMGGNASSGSRAVGPAWGEGQQDAHAQDLRGPHPFNEVEGALDHFQAGTASGAMWHQQFQHTHDAAAVHLPLLTSSGGYNVARAAPPQYFPGSAPPPCLPGPALLGSAAAFRSTAFPRVNAGQLRSMAGLGGNRLQDLQGYGPGGMRQAGAPRSHPTLDAPPVSTFAAMMAGLGPEPAQRTEASQIPTGWGLQPQGLQMCEQQQEAALLNEMIQAAWSQLGSPAAVREEEPPIKRIELQLNSPLWQVPPPTPCSPAAGGSGAEAADSPRSGRPYGGGDLRLTLLPGAERIGDWAPPAAFEVQDCVAARARRQHEMGLLLETHQTLAAIGAPRGLDGCTLPRDLGLWLPDWHQVGAPHLLGSTLM